ncbi:hypothetical protein AKJ55_00305 [candidate division MSBL1 archaeon SCGC-AAA382M17]|uniref:UspA domain-containing protein n=1 Tax=candidate division MSBL1 archaeon SCGC-AAA382M17 TaxID=1698284 RepID=A0ABR5TJZ8_9EURY|nr:hypothetical protein AKJ55_00305 [candidate division MSBL1 archaeon SCGC-AAA382M17]
MILENEYNLENLLVPVRHPDDVNRVTELASLLLDRGRITFLTVVEKGSFPSSQKNWRISSDAIERHSRKFKNRWVEIVPRIRYSDSVWEGVLEQAEIDDSDLILIGWGGKITFRSLRQTPMERIFANSDRDVIAFKSRIDSVRNIKRILIPVGYKGYDYTKRLSVTAKIIKETGAECVLTHVNQEEESEEEAEEILQSSKELMRNMGVNSETKILRNEDISEALIEESSDYDLIVLGPTNEYVFSRYLFGWMTDEIVNNVECSALVFKEGERKWKAWLKGVVDRVKSELSFR